MVGTAISLVKHEPLVDTCNSISGKICQLGIKAQKDFLNFDVKIGALVLEKKKFMHDSFLTYECFKVEIYILVKNCDLAIWFMC